MCKNPIAHKSSSRRFGAASGSPFKLAAAALVLAGALSVGESAADPLVPARQTCTTLNCGTLALPARINAHPASPALANTWVGQFAGQTASCFRFHVTTETRNLAMTVVAPNGVVFTNDDGGVPACRGCPRVVIATVLNGYYTVTISNRDGAAAETFFGLRVGLYNSGNSPNCASPTVAE